MSAADRSPPWAEQSPAISARIASPLREAYMRSSSASSSVSLDEPVPAADSAGCDAVSGSIHVRYARSTTAGFSEMASRPSKTVPVTVKYRSRSYISTTRPPGWPLRDLCAQSGLLPRKMRCRPSPEGDTSVYVPA